MKETILITGAGPNGVTGRRIKELLNGKYILLTPSSKELDLTDDIAVDNYFATHNIDYVIHCAVQSPSMQHDNSDASLEVENNLRMYFNLAKHSCEFKKMFYFGSGAEFDKSRPIENVSEEESKLHVPENRYGLIKYIINQHSNQSKNIYNIRLFGTINPYEPYTRNVVSNLCAKAVLGLPLNLRRDCCFSFVDIDDVVRFIEYAFYHDLHRHDYNMCTWKGKISELARMISEFTENKPNIIFEQAGLNREYSGSDTELKKHFCSFSPIEISLKKVFDYVVENKEVISSERIDSRWIKKK